MSCLDVVCSGLVDALGPYRRCSARERQLGRHWLESLGVLSLAGLAFEALSVGQQRLVLVARALAKSPALVILDEPCQGLDAAHRGRILAALDGLAEGELEAGLIYVSHDPRALPRSLTHVMRLDGGRVVAQGRCAVAGEQDL